MMIRELDKQPPSAERARHKLNCIAIAERAAVSAARGIAWPIDEASRQKEVQLVIAAGEWAEMSAAA